MIKYIFILENLSKTIEKMNEKLGKWTGQFDSPIYGTAIFLFLLLVAMFFINSSSKK